jgi:DeoR/GlpR family transcriptional regulator of sugar metabolism
VCDSSKLGRAGFVPIKPVSAIHTLITDANAPDGILDALRFEGVDVILVD